MHTEDFVEYLLFHYRWVFVCLFLLPCSFLYDIYVFLKNWASFCSKSAHINHQKKVQFVQKQVREWMKSGQKVPMCTARPGWKSTMIQDPQYKDKFFNVQVDMSDILKVDEDKKTVLVEPLVDMGQITAHLMPIGWTIPVLPELESLTVGGLVNGQGVESSSHIFGLFQHVCVSFELVTADGTVITCSKDENSDVFYAIPWSYGTLGFLTSVEIKIIPAKRYVELLYEPVYSLDEAMNVFEREIRRTSGNLFVEGIMFSKERGVIMTGNMVNAPKKAVNKIGRWYKEWFYKHVESFLQSGKGTEYIPLRHYYHRHTRSFFWEIEDIIPFGNHWLFRWILGWMTPPKIAFLKLTQTDIIKKLYNKRHVVQDLLPPLTAVKELIEYYDKVYHVYPLWLCPFKLSNDPGFVHSTNDNDEFFVDIGLYGTVKADVYDNVKTNLDAHKVLKKYKGYEMLYGGTYGTREDFHEMFDHSLYAKVRSKLNCKNAFPEVYDKVNKEARK